MMIVPLWRVLTVDVCEQIRNDVTVEQRCVLKYPPPFVPVAGVPFAASTRKAAVGWFVSGADSTAQAQDPFVVAVRFANAFSVSVAHTDYRYRATLTAPESIVFADGTPVALTMLALTLVSRFLGLKQLPVRYCRVRGPSFLEDVLDVGQQHGLRHYFVGSTEVALDRLSLRAAARWSKVCIAGTYSPPFADVDDDYVDAIVRKIVASNANVVWVGLGTPKQDFVALEICRRTARPCLGVGAAFDFLAGTVPEPPRILAYLGLEWAFRLYTEPARLWKRYTVGTLGFCAAVAVGLFRRPVDKRTHNE